MASITGSVTIAGDPDDWIACAFDASTYAFAGVAAVAAGAYEITGLTAGKAYVVSCRPKTGAVWIAESIDYSVNDLIIPTDPESTPYIFKATAIANAGGDEYFDNVVLLLPFAGENNSTDFVDIKGHAISRVGDVIISTAQAKYHASSAYFDGSGDHLSVTDSADFDLPGDFCIEYWFRSSAFNAQNVVVSLSGTNFVTLGCSYIGKLMSSIGQVSGTLYSTTTITTDAWHHAALVRHNGIMRIYLDGVTEGGSLSASGTVQPSSVIIGAANSSSGNPYLGYVSDVRITKGQPRYTGNFTLPADAFPQAGFDPTGSVEPTWPTTPGNTVVDGGVTWTNMGALIDPIMRGPVIAV